MSDMYCIGYLMNKYTFPRWIESFKSIFWCFFISNFFLNDKLPWARTNFPNHLFKKLLGRFSFSWTVRICAFKLYLAENEVSHRWQFSCFFFSCTAEICVFNFHFEKKLMLHKWHLNGLFFSWTDATCWSRAPLVFDPIPQIVHRYGFIFSWTALMWILSEVFKKHVVLIS